MKRTMTWMTAFMVAVAVFATSVETAEAGLFNRNNCRKARRGNDCCQQVSHCQTVSYCEPVSACGCEAAPACGCEAAPAAPCGCEVASCGCETACDSGCLTRREARRARRNGCCIQQCSTACNTCGSCGSAAVSSCGYETSSPCGCAASSDCGCSGSQDSSSSQGGQSPEKAPDLPEDAST